VSNDIVLSLCVGTFCRLFFLEEFSLLLVELLVFESVSRTVTDDEALLPDCNVIVCGPSVLVAAAALTILASSGTHSFAFSCSGMSLQDTLHDASPPRLRAQAALSNSWQPMPLEAILNNHSILYINKFSKYEKEDALFNGINCPASIVLIGIHQGNSMQGTYCRQFDIS
jgi:hypothetical protein